MTGIDFYPAIRRKKQNEAYTVRLIVISFVLAVMVFILDVTNVLF